MRRFLPRSLAFGFLLATAPAFTEDTALPFRVQRVSDRVVVLTEISPWESNHVVIVGAKGLVLVDPGHTALMGRLIRAKVAELLGRDRFAYVIDTHGHWGHTWGNAAFPEAVVIGHEQAARTMEADRANLEARAQFIAGRLEVLQQELNEADAESDEAAELRLQRDHFDRIARGLAETGFQVVPPQLTFTDRLNLDLGDVTLEMAFLGSGHSQSDIAIMIPEEKILLIGCFFLEQGPLPVFGTQPVLDPDRWLQVFDALLEDENAIEYVVLGQHSVWSRDQLVAIRDYIAALWAGVKAADAEGVDFETALGELPSPDMLDFVREAGASEEDLKGYQRREATALWRQLKESAAAQVEQAINEGGTQAGIALCRKLIAENDPEVYFDENEFNLLGYRYLGQGRIDEAIAVFQLNVDQHPDSWNVYDSLGEAYAAKGDSERAIELYQKSTDLNPGNTNGVQVLERLRAEAPKPPAQVED